MDRNLEAAQKELEALKNENSRLKTLCISIIDTCTEQHAKLTSRNETLEKQVEFFKASKQGKIGELACNIIKNWHAPFSLPVKLLSAWLNEIKIWTPKSLGGKSFSRVVTAFEQGGFEDVERLLNQSRVTPFMRGNAYIALARSLQIKRRFPEMLEAAHLAYLSDPQAFRLKWYAFRLAECDEVAKASQILSFLQHIINFSDTEQKMWIKIQAQAYAQTELDSRIAITDELARLNHDFSDNEDSLSKALFRHDEEKLITVLLQDGFEAMMKVLNESCQNENALISLKLIRLSQCVDLNINHKFRMLQKAAELYPTAINLRTFFWFALKCQRLHAAYDALTSYREINSSAQDFLEHSKRMENSAVSQFDLFDLIRKPATLIKPEFIKNRICYILHNSLPYSSGGYASRSHGLAQALQNLGYEIIAVTRPGYPLDLKDDLSPDEIDIDDCHIDGINYQRILSPKRKFTPVIIYIEQASKVLEDKFRVLKPALVMAASNHVTALPALIAARKLNIPFIYEVRGLWEITHMSRDEHFKHTTDFEVQRVFEAKTCLEADKVFTLTGGIKNELVERGALAQKITLAPNACDPERFTPKPKNIKLLKKYAIPSNVCVIGYIGTFVIYEGLENLAQACALLKKGGLEFRLLLVGSENASGNNRGPITAEIQRIAAENNFLDWLIMPGRVPHEEVEDYYSLIDIAPFPRKPWPVCEMVSPIKPLEAMAMEKAIIVSSVQALAEMITDEETGLIYYKGHTEDLADKLRILIQSPELRHKLGKNARKFLLENRTWQKIASQISNEIDKIILK